MVHDVMYLENHVTVSVIVGEQETLLTIYCILTRYYLTFNYKLGI